MAGDRARISYARGRKYREMVGLQGRVSLEADINEGQRISSEEVRSHALDFVGPSGTPDDGYKITAPPADFQIGPGTMYTGGVRTTLEQQITYSTQKDWLDTAQPQPWADDLWRPVNQLSQGNSQAMLVLTEREVTAVEDPALREVALGGPDSMARTRIVQRVIAAATDQNSCAGAAGAMAAFWSDHGLIYEAKTASLLPRARLQVTPIRDQNPPSPCDPPAASGYLGADNQLIRVQLVAFDANTRKGKLLWAYHNSSNFYRVKALDATTLELAARPVSAEFEPRSGQVVQVLLPAAELAPAVPNVFPDGAWIAALTGHRAKLIAPYAAETKRVTLPGALPAVFPLNSATPPLFLRVWEEELDFELANPVTLTGTGLQVTVSAVNAGMLHIGDSWSFAVRPLTPNAVYPESYIDTPQPPDSPRMWVCSLAVLRPLAAGAAGGGFQVDDCRVPFDPLTTPHGQTQDCCCVKVTPKDAEKLQEVVNQAVAKANGAAVSIHLEPGLYKLRTPLTLDSRHSGVVIESCAGTKPVLTGGEDPRFIHGLIIAIGTADITIRGLEFRMVPVKPPDGFLDIMKRAALAGGLPGFNPPRQLSIGVRVIQTVSITIENCDFRLPPQDATFSVGMLVQGDNGSVEVQGCRFDGPGAESAGVLLAPAPVADNRDGLLRHGSVEVLRIEKCTFARATAGIILAGETALAFIQGNLTRYVNSSLIALWFDEKLLTLKQVWGAMVTKSSSALVQKFVASFKKDPILSELMATAVLIPLEKLENQVGKEREFIYSLVDLTAKDAEAGKMAPPDALRMTLSGNQFDARPVRGTGGPDTLVWDLNSTSAEVNISHDTHWNRSDLATLVLLQCEGFNVTGNVIGNEKKPGTEMPSLLVEPELPNPAPKPPIFPCTVTGNTMFGRTNLADFTRAEWQALPAGMPLTWEFFNSILLS